MIRTHFLRTMSDILLVKEPSTKGHHGDTFSGPKRCPLKTGFTVFLNKPLLLTIGTDLELWFRTN